MAACASCGGQIGLSRRLRGATRCDDCERRAKAARDSALLEYDSAVAAVIAVGHAGPETVHLGELERVITEGGGSFEDRKLAAFRRVLDEALQDEVLTGEEERRLLDTCEALYRTTDRVTSVLAPYVAPLFIAKVNDGRLPVVATGGQLLLRKGEVLHVEVPATTLKEVIQREFRGGSQGVSIPVAKGVRYRVGAFRGHMVEVGRSWVPEDSGTLSVSSQRMVFTGQRRSIELAYAKLLNLSVFTDGLQVHVSNRQKPSTFRLQNGPVIAAVVHAAMQRLLE
jgi:hypothetical protein